VSQAGRTLADEITRLIEINRTTINGLTYGDLIFRAHQGRLVEVIASETLKLAAGAQLCPLLLKKDESE
jgi:hypothetical protein